MQKRFVIVDCFTRPLWLTPLKWQETFDKAVLICSNENWIEAIFFVNLGLIGIARKLMRPWSRTKQSTMNGHWSALC